LIKADPLFSFDLLYNQ